MPLPPPELTGRLKAHARELGFDAAGICRAEATRDWPGFQKWLTHDYHGTMRWLKDRSEAYRHPDSVLAGVRSLVVLTRNYRTADPVTTQPGHGRISRYAWGASDYHDVIHDQLKQLARWMQTEVPSSQNRGVVDTAPLLERQLGQIAGLGWQGKNTLLIQPHAGSLFFLAVLLTDVVLEYDPPFPTDHCGTCTACLDACPTRAFVQPYVLDARRCISYLTIELRDDIPTVFREQMGEWIFGCDVCQDVCPWNRHAPIIDDARFFPALNDQTADLCQLLTMDEDAFRERFRKTPLWRSKRRGVLRNAAIALGARPDPAFVGALEHGLADAEPLVRSASAWALGQVGSQTAKQALESQMPRETDPAVCHEIQQALAHCARSLNK